MARPPLTFRRLFGLDRSGPPPPETLPGAPLRPWTIPNAIGYVRLLGIPAFLVVAFSSDTGRDALAVVIFGLIAWGDYADGIAARVTGQYSRMGSLLDPVVDRLLVISGVVVCYHFDLLPRWAIVVLVAREALMLAIGPLWVRKGLELRINWPGRLSVTPIMGAFPWAMAGLLTVGAVLLYIGVAMALVATALYVRDGVRQLSS